MTLAGGTFDNVVSLVEAIAWPLIVLLILLALRPYLPEIARGLARRVTRVSWASVSMEFAVATEVRPEVWGALQVLRDPGSSGLVAADSSQMLFTLIREGERSDSATLDLGTGNRWLTSRLFIFSVILCELLGVRCMVFLETRDGIPKRFVGVADPRAVRAAMRLRWDWYERAFLSALLNFGAASPETMTRLRERLLDPGVNIKQLAPWTIDPQLRSLFADSLTFDLSKAQQAENAANMYLASPLISRTVASIQPEEKEWLRLGDAGDGTVREEHAQWIKDADHLSRILRDALKTPSLVEVPGTSGKDLERQAVMTDDGEFVAILDPEGRFKRLLNRRTVVERVARQMAEPANDA
jgi:hypothetical protein